MGCACRHCGYKGSHKSSSCWEKFPHLKQKRGRSPSRKGGEKPKDKKRDKSPFPKKKNKARQVSDSDRGSKTECDSDIESATEGAGSSPERAQKTDSKYTRARRTKALRVRSTKRGFV